MYYQYLIRNNNLIDRFISVIQSFKTSLLREHKEFVYENVEEKNKTIQSYKGYFCIQEPLLYGQKD